MKPGPPADGEGTALLSPGRLRPARRPHISRKSSSSVPLHADNKNDDAPQSEVASPARKRFHTFSAPAAKGDQIEGRLHVGVIPHIIDNSGPGTSSSHSIRARHEERQPSVSRDDEQEDGDPASSSRSIPSSSVENLEKSDFEADADDIISHLRLQLAAREGPADGEVNEEGKTSPSSKDNDSSSQEAPPENYTEEQARSIRRAAQARRKAEWRAARERGELPALPKRTDHGRASGKATPTIRYTKSNWEESSGLPDKEQPFMLPTPEHIPQVPDEEPFGEEAPSSLLEECQLRFRSRLGLYALMHAPLPQTAADPLSPHPPQQTATVTSAFRVSGMDAESDVAGSTSASVSGSPRSGPPGSTALADAQPPASTAGAESPRTLPPSLLSLLCRIGLTGGAVPRPVFEREPKEASTGRGLLQALAAATAAVHSSGVLASPLPSMNVPELPVPQLDPHTPTDSRSSSPRRDSTIATTSLSSSLKRNAAANLRVNIGATNDNQRSNSSPRSRSPLMRRALSRDYDATGSASPKVWSPSAQGSITPTSFRRSGGRVAALREATAASSPREPPTVLQSANQLPTLEFESRFESGNLRLVTQVGPSEYDLQLATDTNTTGHTQWYYFRVSNMQKGVAYTFNIINMYKADSLYNHGQKPLMYSTIKAKQQGIGWHRVGERICYFNNGLRRNWETTNSRKMLLRLMGLTPLPSVNADDDANGCPAPPVSGPAVDSGLSLNGQFYTLTFTITFDESDDVIYLAHCHPYTLSQLQTYLANLDEDPKNCTRLRRWQMCETLAGNDCDCITITEFSPGIGKNIRERQGVFLTARVHPGETSGSFLIKGVIDFLLSESPEAEALRRHFVFKIVPMLNPDGVVNGNYRTSLTGHDLNRRWQSPSMVLHPTIYNCKILLRRLCEDREVVVFCDFHGHSRKFNTFMYGCDRKFVRKDQRFQNPEMPIHERVFPRVLDTISQRSLYFPNCSFKVHIVSPRTLTMQQVQSGKESAARVAVWREYGICCSYTLEASMCGAAVGERAGLHYTPRDLESLGGDFCRGLLRIWQRDAVDTTNSDLPDLPDDLSAIPEPEDMGPQICGWTDAAEVVSSDSDDDTLANIEGETPKRTKSKDKSVRKKKGKDGGKGKERPSVAAAAPAPPPAPAPAAAPRKTKAKSKKAESKSRVVMLVDRATQTTPPLERRAAGAAAMALRSLQTVDPKAVGASRMVSPGRKETRRQERQWGDSLNSSTLLLNSPGVVTEAQSPAGSRRNVLMDLVSLQQWAPSPIDRSADPQPSWARFLTTEPKAQERSG